MLKFKIVTPERVLLEKDIDSLTVPTQTGEITVLTNHIPLVSNIKPGELRFKDKTGETIMAVSSGFLEVRPNNEVVILADTAELANEIDLDRAEKARQQAQEMMKENYQDQKLSADAMGILEKNLARLRVGKKHRTHTNRNLESGNLHE